MDIKNLIYGSFISSVGTIIIGSLFKIQHWPNAEFMIIIGLLSQYLCAICCLYEINKSNKLKKGDQLMWFFAFILFPLITGLVYILSARNKILNLK